MSVALIWAQSVSGVIGRGGGIPWQLPEDLVRFKQLTMGHDVVMGRRTWESLPARFRPLPGRRNIVLTRNPNFQAPGADVVTDVDEAFTGSGGQVDSVTWVIGGAEIYHLALPVATRCEVTEVDIKLQVDDEDALAPMLSEAWVGTAGQWRDSASGLRYRFLSYVRA